LLSGRDGNRQRDRRATRQPWLAKNGWAQGSGGDACPGLRAQLGGGKLARLFGQPQMLLWKLGYFG